MNRRTRILVLLPALGLFAFLLMWAVVDLPDFGDYVGPYGYLLNHVVVPERHMTNVVTAVVFDYRGFDTMGEEFILFGAVTGVVLLLRADERGEKDVGDAVGSDTVRVVGIVLAGATLLVGLWLIAFGFVTPGGGFQGGVIVAAAVFCVFLCSDFNAWRGVSSQKVLDPLEGLGAGGYVVIGLAALVAGFPFLTNELLGPGVPGTLQSGGVGPFVNWSVALAVTAAILVLFGEFLEEYIVPLATGGTNR
ncbi:MAG TPA: MnhB domain-containing protein [Gaiellaceae bacterium]|nr:MnhB domain-containing protein [Gaiellaceae bacterium]